MWNKSRHEITCNHILNIDLVSYEFTYLTALTNTSMDRVWKHWCCPLSSGLTYSLTAHIISGIILFNIEYFSWKICFQYCAHATVPSLVIVECWHKSFSNKMNYSNYFFTEWCLKQMYFNLLGIGNEIYMSLRSCWLINVLKREKAGS